MKKRIVLILIIIFCIILIFFSLNKKAIENDQNTEHSSNNIESSYEKKESKNEEYKPSLELLYDGKMDDIQFGIGTDSSDLIAQWGNPNQNSNFMSGTLLEYDDIYFFVNDNIIVGIYYTGEQKKYGVQIGMSLEQAEEILGTPDSTYSSQSSELYPDDQLILNYKADKYMVNLELNPDDKKIVSISIWEDDGQQS